MIDTIRPPGRDLPSRTRIPLGSVLNRVTQQVDQDLLDPARVRLAARQSRAGLEEQGDLLEVGRRASRGPSPRFAM